MTQQMTDGARRKRFFALQEPDATEPYALAAWPESGLPMRYVPGRGFVDWPDLAPALMGWGADARDVREVSGPEAAMLMVKGVGALDDAYVEQMMGRPDGNPTAPPGPGRQPAGHRRRWQP